jgi:hypothetical protein
MIPFDGTDDFVDVEELPKDSSFSVAIWVQAEQ